MVQRVLVSGGFAPRPASGSRVPGAPRRGCPYANRDRTLSLRPGVPRGARVRYDAPPMSTANPAGPVRHFASDNYAGICPEAWAAMAEANEGHAPGYGEDRWTAEAADLVRDTFETDCEVFFVFNGTAANSLALAAMCQSYHSILCHEAAHVETDECGAPEFFSNGTKVLTVSGHHGKVLPDQVDLMV
jgi:hypothetical protein